MSSALAAPPEPSSVATVSQPRLTNTTLLIGACAVLLLAPLAFGAVQPWSIFALEACAAVLFLVWASRQWLNRRNRHFGQPSLPSYGGLFCAGSDPVGDGITAYRHVTYTHLAALRRIRHVGVCSDSNFAPLLSI